MMNAIMAAQHEHDFIYRGWEGHSHGNPYAHAILRGYVNRQGVTHPNYHYETLVYLAQLYEKWNLENPAVIIDCNHSNSGKNPFEQPRIMKEVLHSCRCDSDLKHLVKGFMVDIASVLPECKEFASEVSEIDPAEPAMRYHAFAGSNAVYVVGLATNLCTQPRVPSFEEVKGVKSIQDDALADLKAQDFKKAVDKVRETVKADLAKRKAAKAAPAATEAELPKSITVNVGGQNYKVEIAYGNDLPAAEQSAAPAAPAGEGADLLAPLEGKFFRVKDTSETPKQVGDQVKEGDVVGYIEAMKTYNAIKADRDGTITAILVNSGDSVEEDDVIMKIG
jgi:biotin carboxyl carrier protein